MGWQPISCRSGPASAERRKRSSSDCSAAVPVSKCAPPSTHLRVSKALTTISSVPTEGGAALDTGTLLLLLLAPTACTAAAPALASRARLPCLLVAGLPGVAAAAVLALLLLLKPAPHGLPAAPGASAPTATGPSGLPAAAGASALGSPAPSARRSQSATSSVRDSEPAAQRRWHAAATARCVSTASGLD